jgi:hypothetical protein
MQPFINGMRVIDYIAGNANVTQTYTFPGTTKANNCIYGLKIKNDGAADDTVTVNGLTMTIKAGEVFEEALSPTNTFTITGTSAFRCWVRGVA